MKALLCVVALSLVATAAASAKTTPGFLGCSAISKPYPKPSVQPKSIVVACGDGGFVLLKLKWSRWNATGAVATGTASQNDCTPNCASGHFHNYPAHVTLSTLASCGRYRVFTKVAWTFTAGRPKGEPRHSSITYPCS